MKNDTRLSVENIKDIYTLSPLQEGIFFSCSLNPSTTAYFEQQSIRQYDPLDIDVLQNSLRVLMERHDILRTVFIQKTTDRPIQVVLKHSPIEFFYEDISGDADKESCLRRYKDLDKMRYFNLSKDILIRLSVFRMETEVYELIWSWHHILMDAWCVNTLKHEFYEIYACLLKNEPIRLSAPVPYRNYIQWLQRQDRQLAAAYWTRYLEGYDGVTAVPFKKTGYMDAASYDTTALELELDEAVSAAIMTALSEWRVTPSTFFQTVWGILLARYNNTRDAVFGIVVAGRPAAVAGVEDIVGLFINTIPVRVRLDKDAGFTDLLREIQNSALNSDEHSYYPLAEIQALQGGRSTLFDHIFLFQNFVTEREEKVDPDQLTTDGKPFSRSEVFERYFYDFNIFLIPGNSISILFKFNGNVYDATDLAQMMQHFHDLIRSIAKDPNIGIDKLTLLSQTRQQELAVTFNPGEYRQLPARGFISLFEEKAAKNPGNIAIDYKDIQVTYQTLNDGADALARYLAERNVGAGGSIGILAHRSERLIVALLGILKTGAAFVPIDPVTPPERLRHIFEDASLDCLITESGFLFLLTEIYRGAIFALDIQLDAMMTLEQPGGKLPIAAGLEDPAYVIYTSGSTGKPKGVTICQRSWLNYLLWANTYYFEDRQGHGFAFFTSLAFDLTITSIFTTLLRGDTIWIYEDKDINTVLTEIFSGHAKADTVKLTPSHISLLPYLPIPATAIRTVIVGGEALTKKHIRILKSLNSAIRIYNEYGPTEATVGCTVKEILQETETITIGAPIWNTRIYILDNDRKMMPPGIEGEIAIGGAGLAEGYLNNETATRQKFHDDPFMPGERIYLTGDLGKWLPNGELFYSGRKDDQVKVRGYRVEPSEIETIVLGFQPVRECACIFNPAGQRLVLYYRADPDLNKEDLIAYLERHLPEYMIPGILVPVSSFRLTANGKIDRRNLPDPHVQQSSGNTPPENETERRLLEIWKEVLESEAIGVEEKFFSIGGHSLKATQMASRILKVFKTSISLQDIFEHQTIRELARIIQLSAQETEEDISPVAVRSYYPLSHSQRRLWIMSRLEQENQFYASPSRFEFDASFDQQAFGKAVEYLVQRHEILRTTFHTINGEPVQVIHPSPKQACTIETRHISAEERQHAIEEEARKPFDLQHGPLLRITVLNMEGRWYTVLLSCHHIISDGWSLEVFIREFAATYKAMEDNLSPSLEPLAIQYKDYAIWHNSLLEQKGPAMRAYWLKKLGEKLPLHGLPTDYKRPDKKTGNSTIYQFSFGQEPVSRLAGLSEATGCTLFMCLLTSVKILLYRLSGEEDTLIGTPIAGRVRKELENQIGNYLNIVVLRDEVKNSLTYRQLLYRIKETTTEAYANQLYPFDLISEELHDPRQRNRHPLFDVGLTLQNQIQPRDAAHASEEKMAGDEEIKNYPGALTDLWFIMEQTTNDLAVSINYDRSLFRRETILSFIEMLRSIMLDSTDNPDIRIGDMAVFAKKGVNINNRLQIKLKI